MPDPDAITRAFLDLRTRLARAVSGIVPPREIEDIVQETYVRVRQAENLDRIRRPDSFMYRTARNLALDFVKRSESRFTRTEPDVEALDDNTGGPVDADETFRAVASDEEFAGFCDAVRYLPQQCRRVFVLRKVYGFSQQEIADAVGIAQSTVEKHIALGVRRTRQHMQQRDQGSAPQAASITDIQAAKSMKEANE